MRPFLVALLLALAVPAHGAATIVQCKTSGGSQAACADGSIQTAKLVDAATFVTLTGTQVLTNKTISGSANTLTNIGNGALTNSSLTLNGGGGVTISNATLALGGSYLLGVDTAVLATLAGTQTFTGAKTFNAAILGGNLVAGGNKVTGLGAPTAASSDAATATYAETVAAAAKTGSGVNFPLISGVTWTANNYLGTSCQATSATANLVVPFTVPAAGKIRDLTVNGLTGISPGANITVHRSVKGSPSYSATTLVANVPNFQYAGSDNTHEVTVAAGDLIILQIDASWNPGGLAASIRYIPD